jgi:hypothetical protein
MPSLQRKGVGAHNKTIRKAIVADKTSITRSRSKAKDQKPRGHEKGKKLGSNLMRTDEALKNLKAALKNLLCPAPATKSSLDKVVATYGGRVKRGTLYKFSKVEGHQEAARCRMERGDREHQVG